MGLAIIILAVLFSLPVFAAGFLGLGGCGALTLEALPEAGGI